MALDWRKHHDKPDNSQSEKEHAAYVESLKQREHQEKVHPHHFPNMATQIAAAGGTYLAYQDWRKHYNRPDNAQSEKEHELHVELHKQGWHRSDHSQPLISELAIGGVIPYMTYHAWRKYYNKADTPESISEHAAYVAAQSHMPQSSTFAPLHAEMTISQVEKASLDQKLSSLKAELQNEWVAIEQLERTAFDQRVQILKREYETRFRSSKDVEESRLNDNLRELKEEHSKEVRDLRKKHDEIERNMKNDHLASLEDLRRQHESAVKKVKQELLDAEHRVQDDRDRRLKDLEEEEFERKSRFEGTKASDFEAFKSDVASKYTRRMREFEDEEMQKFNAKTHELKVKHEVDLSALREKMKQEQATTLASNLQNLTEVERLKYENEKEAIRLKYDADLSEIKSKEQKKFDALRAEIEASTEAKLRDLRDIGQKNESDEQARLEKLIKIQSEDARQKEEIAKSRLQLENDMKLERLRLELEAETRKLELNLQQTHSADMDAFKMKTAREMDEHKRKITNDHSRMLSILEAEYSRKIEAAKFKLLEGEKQTELKLIMEKEQEIAARKARAESEQRDVARLERDVENARIKVLAEKEALAQMERGITAALADEKLKLRLTEAKRDYAHSTKYDDGKPLDEIESECLIDTELDSSSMKEFDETPTKKHLRSLAESKIDQLIEQHFEGRSYATKPLSPLTESSKTETDDIAFKTKLNQIFNLKVDTKSNESRLHRRHKSSDLSEKKSPKS
ncbi:hypothetical protein BC830DRAFT_700851 [Chytriomyces sp. MP71]|nr:hypothetical protein BC830DRAFT_700851 [Chytriomyces sp. MP71]